VTDRPGSAQANLTIAITIPATTNTMIAICIQTQIGDMRI
jgi:hypothetical protein